MAPRQSALRHAVAGSPFARCPKPKWIGTIEATDEREAIEKAAKEFRTHASKLIAVRRRSLILRPREKTPRVC